MSSFVSSRNLRSLQSDNLSADAEHSSEPTPEDCGGINNSNSTRGSNGSRSCIRNQATNESDGLTHFVRELRLARQRFKHGAVYWKRVGPVGDRSNTDVNKSYHSTSSRPIVS
jgi:hypothetical protein